ncbi:MAG: hypothetical protein LBD72_01165 [Puniceicoccales bacterium]|nr:hypothetical protein [Puniceicoccales bacterium]
MDARIAVSRGLFTDGSGSAFPSAFPDGTDGIPTDPSSVGLIQVNGLVDRLLSRDRYHDALARLAAAKWHVLEAVSRAAIVRVGVDNWGYALLAMCLRGELPEAGARVVRTFVNIVPPSGLRAACSMPPEGVTPTHAGDNPDDLSSIGSARVRDYVDYLLSLGRYHAALAALDLLGVVVGILLLEAVSYAAIVRVGVDNWGYAILAMCLCGGLPEAEARVVRTFANIVPPSGLRAACRMPPEGVTPTHAGDNPDDLSSIGWAHVRDYVDRLLSLGRCHDALAALGSMDPSLRALMLEAVSCAATVRVGVDNWGYAIQAMSALGGLSAAETAVVVVFSANAGRVDVQSLFASAFANAPAGGNPDDLPSIGWARVRGYLDCMLSSDRYHDALDRLNAAEPSQRALMLEALRRVAIERTGEPPPFWGHAGVDFAESSECLIGGRVDGHGDSMAFGNGCGWCGPLFEMRGPHGCVAAESGIIFESPRIFPPNDRHDDGLS